MQKGGYLDSLAEFIGRWCINQKVIDHVPASPDNMNFSTSQIYYFLHNCT